MSSPRATIWVLGDQLHPESALVRAGTPATHRLLLVESDAKVGGASWHVQRAHLVLAAMRRFTADRRAEGWSTTAGPPRWPPGWPPTGRSTTRRR
jgi:deoxyribodipyrimidine photolyase-like uncharacterized protein